MMTGTTKWLATVAITALVGCQIAETGSNSPAPTDEAVQAASGSSSCNADLPELTKFIPGTTQIQYALPVTTKMYVVYQDWVAGTGWIAGLVDTTTGKIEVAYSIAQNQLPLFMYYQSLRGRIIVPNTPPPPNPGGNRGIAITIVDTAILTTDASTNAASDAHACGY